VFGWSAVLGNPVYSSSVVCENDCDTFRLRSADLRGLENAHAETAGRVMNRLADSVSARWEKSQAQVRSMLAKGISESVGPLKKEA